jgi:hypothetical protein
LTTVPLTFDGLVGFVISHPRIAVSGRKDVSIGGLQGVEMDLAMKSAADDACSDGGHYVDVMVGMDPSSLVHGLIPGYKLRLYLLHFGQDTLAIEIADAPGGGSDFPDWPTGADGVVATFKFTP